MHLFLTSTLPFLGHNHASAAAFLTSRHHNYHGSIIPEFLSNEERVRKFCEARQEKELEADKQKQYKNVYNLFVQTPLMQFSPSLIVSQKDCAESIVKPLLETKYFTRTLQRCSVGSRVPLRTDLFQGLSQVRSLIKLDLGLYAVKREQLEIIINSFPSLETLTIENAKALDSTITISNSSPPPPATQALRNLTMRRVSGLFAAQFVPHFSNLKKLVLSGSEDESFSDDEDKLLSSDDDDESLSDDDDEVPSIDDDETRSMYEYLSDDEDESLSDDEDNALNLQLLSSARTHLADVSLKYFILSEVESLKYLTQLSSLVLTRCKMPDLNFLSASQEKSPLPISKNKLLTTLCIDECYGFSKSPLASLAHASELRVLRLDYSRYFRMHFTDKDPLSDDKKVKPNKCLECLKNMIHLRSLHLTIRNIVGDSRSFNTLMQNSFQLQELNLESCRDLTGAIAGSLYNTHSKLRVLNLNRCDLDDDDLKGIGALKNTLEVLRLARSCELTNETLVHCKYLAKLKILDLESTGINNLSPLFYYEYKNVLNRHGVTERLRVLKGCLKLENLDVSWCDLNDESFRVFSEEPNSFPNLSVLYMHQCDTRTGVFEHLSKNNHLVHRLKELNVRGMRKILLSSETARKNLCQLQGLRELHVTQSRDNSNASKDLKRKLMRELKNLEGF